MADERRKKRDLTTTICSTNEDHKKETIFASYSMLRGFLNTLDAQDQICSNYFICQASREASKVGHVGQLLAKVASSNAESWLTSVNATLHKGTKYAGIKGSGEKVTDHGREDQNSASCEKVFPCKNFPKTYKKPKLL